MSHPSTVNLRRFIVLRFLFLRLGAGGMPASTAVLDGLPGWPAVREDRADGHKDRDARASAAPGNVLPSRKVGHSAFLAGNPKPSSLISESPDSEAAAQSLLACCASTVPRGEGQPKPRHSYMRVTRTGHPAPRITRCASLPMSAFPTRVRLARPMTSRSASRSLAKRRSSPAAATAISPT